MGWASSSSGQSSIGVELAKISPNLGDLVGISIDLTKNDQRSTHIGREQQNFGI